MLLSFSEKPISSHIFSKKPNLRIQVCAPLIKCGCSDLLKLTVLGARIPEVKRLPEMSDRLVIGSPTVVQNDDGLVPIDIAALNYRLAQQVWKRWSLLKNRIFYLGDFFWLFHLLIVVP